jgi:hypothetical protein
VVSPLTVRTCAVTFIARHRYMVRCIRLCFDKMIHLSLIFVAFLFTCTQDALHSRGTRNINELEAVAREYGCTTQVLFLHNMPISEQIAQLRYNTSLLVGADGTGLLNAVCQRHNALMFVLNIISFRIEIYVFSCTCLCSCVQRCGCTSVLLC